jgi:hypothetical protein
MPKQPKVDDRGTLQHVVGREIERTRILRKDTGREDFLSRLGNLCQEGFLVAYSEDLPELQKYL